MVNFRKRQKAAEVIQDIKRWQAMPFSLTSVGTILSFLEDSFNKYVDGVDYGDVRARGLEAPRAGAAQHAVVLADHARDRQDCDGVRRVSENTVIVATHGVVK